MNQKQIIECNYYGYKYASYRSRQELEDIKYMYLKQGTKLTDNEVPPIGKLPPHMQNALAWNERFNKLRRDDYHLYQMTFKYKQHSNYQTDTEERLNRRLGQFLTNYLFHELLGNNWRRANKTELVPFCVGYIDESKKEHVVTRNGLERAKHHHCMIAIHPKIDNKFQRFVGYDTFKNTEFGESLKNSFVQETGNSTMLYDAKCSGKYPDFIAYGGFHGRP